MIDQVRADASKGDFGIDADRFQVLGRAYSRAEENCRGSDGTTTQCDPSAVDRMHGAAAGTNLNADSATSIENHSINRRVRENLQVFAPSRWEQVGDRWTFERRHS